MRVLPSLAEPDLVHIILTKKEETRVTEGPERDARNCAGTKEVIEMTEDTKPHSEPRWFHEYGWIGPEDHEEVLVAAEIVGFEFVYGGATKEPTEWQGYPAEYARLEEQFETVRKAVEHILERDGICPLCEYIPGTRENKQQHYSSCAFGVSNPAKMPAFENREELPLVDVEPVDPSPASSCDGSATCKATTHLHGCFSEARDV